jgi:hypothetical protein
MPTSALEMQQPREIVLATAVTGKRIALAK